MNRPGWTVGPPSRLMLLVSHNEPAYTSRRKRERCGGWAAGAHLRWPRPSGHRKSVSANVRIGGVDVVDDAELAARCPLEPPSGTSP
jgi:hypothetical protein